MRWAVFFGALFCLTASAVVSGWQSGTGVKTQPWAKFLGSWKDVPGPDDPSVLKVEPEGEGMKFSFNCKKDGSCLDVIIGKVVSTTTRKISEDGRKMVGTSRNAEGKITLELTHEKID